MITAVDSNVLIDILRVDASFGARSMSALRRCLNEGALVACEVVWAETIAGAGPPSEVRRRLESSGIGFGAMTLESSERAGVEWSQYRRRGGPRTRLVADFLIGAHALNQADRLLTRDRGFYRSYFPDLTILDPTAN